MLECIYTKQIYMQYVPMHYIRVIVYTIYTKPMTLMQIHVDNIYSLCASKKKLFLSPETRGTLNQNN